jgi:hypothetical protein
MRPAGSSAFDRDEVKQPPAKEKSLEVPISTFSFFNTQ